MRFVVTLEKSLLVNMKLIFNNVSSVLLIFLVVLANAQRTSNSLRDVGKWIFTSLVLVK